MKTFENGMTEFERWYRTSHILNCSDEIPTEEEYYASIEEFKKTETGAFFSEALDCLSDDMEKRNGGGFLRRGNKGD